MSKIPKIQVTRNYRMFDRSPQNRLVTPEEHTALRESLVEHGFLPFLPIICIRNENTGRRIVKDGQNRLTLAEELGLPVFYVDIDPSQDFDVAQLARTGKAWKPRDYANMHAANGLVDYEKAIAFADEHQMTVALAFAILAGCTGFAPISQAFYAGEFVIKDRPWANAVVATYAGMIAIQKKLKGHRFLLACMSVCRVPGFNRARLISGANRQRDKLVTYATVDGYLKMLEELYNYGQSEGKKTPLHMEAQKAMKSRNPSKRGKADKEE